MSQIIQEQLVFLVTAMCAGMFLMCGYDVLRLWRWLVPHNAIWLWLEDILYWSAMSLPVFVMFYRRIDGVLRWYGMVGLFVGGVLYEWGISLPIRKGVSRLVKRIQKFTKKRRAGLRKS